jgi:predicted  nucleic acid-binding Zn-ribbon protein
VGELQQLQPLGTTWSEANAQDSLLLKAHLRQIEARIADLATKLGARIADLDNRVDLRLDAQERQQHARLEDTMSTLIRRHEELQAPLKMHSEKAIADGEERIRVYAKSCHDDVGKLNDSFQKRIRESNEALRMSMERELHDCKNSCNAQVQELTVHVSASCDKLNSVLPRVSDLESRGAEQQSKFDRLGETLERCALATQLPPLDARLVNTENLVTSLDAKVTATEAKFDEANRLLKDQVRAEAEARKMLVSPVQDLEQRFENYKERVRLRFDSMQEDLSTKQEWSAKRFEAHSEALRRLDGLAGIVALEQVNDPHLAVIGSDPECNVGAQTATTGPASMQEVGAVLEDSAGEARCSHDHNSEPAERMDVDPALSELRTWKKSDLSRRAHEV